MKRTVLVAAAAAVLLVGCSSGGDGPTEVVSTQGATPTAAMPGVDEARAKLQREVEGDATMTVKPEAAGGLYGVSPAGVTTSVNVPPNISGPEFNQTCQEAAVWLAMLEGGTPELNAESMLQVLQSDPSEFGMDPNSPEVWANGTPQMHADVIAAVNAAARGEC
ncbi:lipoprotein LpqV [Rhodococcus sp. UNC363MFTsu5.1]|uniref:lipoprotein LpqV n=1 Tax=Rhodococcus sp. UNC363MFTsu5.1 TaxID=1449069 RepID=UPI000AB6B8DF|nr:lipoprotein LpqV [Rhodococcus sp. UNC363MFTsu5.1]